ncbi:MAG TPA: glycerate kinase [Bacteroidales bacterium]
MNILIAPDSFKDALSSREVANYLKAGMIKVIPDWLFDLVPLADGGEGTVETILSSVKGETIRITVHDPLMRQISSFIGFIPVRTALIEMAAASGLMLVSEGERNPWVTTSFGTGELIKTALDNDCKTIILGIGGSATNDAGVGIAMALGVKFLDEKNNPVSAGGGEVGRIRKIDISGLDARISDTEILVACDVTNPLTGPDGASAVYSPQKGADTGMVKELDANLVSLARVIKEQLGKDVETLPGAGAAGGMGAGLVAFLDAKLVRGFDLVASVTRLEQKIANADIVITGEGKVDGQTPFGKTAFGVAQLAKKHKKPVILVAGTIAEGAEVLYSMGVSAMMSVINKPMPLEEALKTTPHLLENTGESIARMLTIR